MTNSPERKQIGGEAVHISDGRVWAEISFLDSSTGYREYLPQNRYRSWPRSGDDFIMLDSSRPLPGSDPKRVWGWVVPAFLLLVTWLFLYFVWESY
jgi:hypothetical protein